MAVAFISVIAAVFLVLIKLIVGIATKSLGIISEAIHSTLDLGASLLTLFAVKVSSKPADETHHYGHGKVENLSAFVQSILLFITCIWIVFEAVRRFFTPIKIDVNIYSFLVMIISILVDFSRSKALFKASQKYNSQALEADAYHFFSDMLSSLIVIIGLISVKLGFIYGDSVAALIISGFIITFSIKLGKRAVNVLLDTAPKGASEKIRRTVMGIDGVVECRNIRVRTSGNLFFINVDVGIDKHRTHKEIQDIVNIIKSRIAGIFPNSDISVSTYSLRKDNFVTEDERFYDEIRAIINSSGMCINLHNLKVFNINNLKHITLHIEIKNNISLEETHRLSHEIESKIKAVCPDADSVNVYVETTKQEMIYAEDITESSQDMINNVIELLNKTPDKLNCHNVRIYDKDKKMIVFLHCGLEGEYSNTEIQDITQKIVNRLKNNIENIEEVYVHVEPVDDRYNLN